MPKIRVTVEEVTTRTVTSRRAGTVEVRVPSRDIDTSELTAFCRELENAGDLPTPKWGKEMEEPEVETVTTIFSYDSTDFDLIF